MSESKSVLKDKSFNFAIRVVKQYKYLTEEKKEYVLSKQLLRSGTAIGALIREALFKKIKMKSFITHNSSLINLWSFITHILSFINRWSFITHNSSLIIKKSLWLFAVILSFSSCSKEVYIFSSFHEPADQGLRFLYSYDGYKWNGLDKVFLKPEIGNQKVMRDPSIVKGPDGTFHLVWTTSWKGDKGFGYASSKDLINWSEQKLIPVMEHEPTTVNVWAPELFYDEDNKQYIIIWASTIPFRFPKKLEEEDNNHRMYYTTTKDFKVFSPMELLIEPGFSVIDAVIVKRKVNDFVLVLKDNTRPMRNMKVAFGPTALGPYTNVSEPFTGNFTEGPSVAKVKDEYLIYFDSYRDKNYGSIKTTDFKTFSDASGETSVPAGHKHGTIFKANKRILKGLQGYAGLDTVKTEE